MIHDRTPRLKSQASSEERRYHVAMTAAGAANQWQSRIAYFWYRKVKAQCEAEGNCQVGG